MFFLWAKTDVWALQLCSCTSERSYMLISLFKHNFRLKADNMKQHPWVYLTQCRCKKFSIKTNHKCLKPFPPPHASSSGWRLRLISSWLERTHAAASVQYSALMPFQSLCSVLCSRSVCISVRPNFISKTDQKICLVLPRLHPSEPWSTFQSAHAGTRDAENKADLPVGGMYFLWRSD